MYRGWPFWRNHINENSNKVEILHYLLGLLQQMMIISSADHPDLLVVSQAQAF